MDKTTHKLLHMKLSWLSGIILCYEQNWSQGAGVGDIEATGEDLNLPSRPVKVGPYLMRNLNEAGGTIQAGRIDEFEKDTAELTVLNIIKDKNDRWIIRCNTILSIKKWVTEGKEKFQNLSKENCIFWRYFV